jgi:hypothetical protein
MAPPELVRERGPLVSPPSLPEPPRRAAFPPADCSPSRARLGRVAAMIADAERATPAGGGRDGRQSDAKVVSLLPRRARAAVPRPRAAEARPEVLQG